MTFNRELSVSSDTKTCWEVLTDVPRLVEWVSIVDDAHEIAPLEKYTAVLMDRLGPFKLRADLDIVVSEVEIGRRIRVRASGEDRQVSSRIGIDAVLTLDDLAAGGTKVQVDGSYEVIGRVATLGAGMIRQKAAKILDEFFGRAATELGGQ
ncbi:MAG TPA: SRPBCC domain-containing protein [Acidothermaceae bacterium]|jgi:carbon monoxide dehydrogenase subunit G|nr:SRPBCC domain-containing protein [Acidothermaceae bacterium]